MPLLQLQEGLQLRSRQLRHGRVLLLLLLLLLGPLRLLLLELLLCGPGQVLKLERSSAYWAGQPEVGPIFWGQCLLQPCARPAGTHTHTKTRLA
jgi:hypothetical protein